MAVTKDLSVIDHETLEDALADEEGALKTSPESVPEGTRRYRYKMQKVHLRLQIEYT